MKKNVKTLLLIAITAIFAFNASSLSAQITQIKSTQLPAQARNTIRTTWNNAPIVNAWRNKDGRLVEYKALVEDGSSMKFNARGEWIEVSSYGGVPTKIFPKALVKHIRDYYDGQQIVRAYKSSRYYRVELTDGSKLEFNTKGVFQAFL